jgi:hypothetical protein
VNSIVAGDSTLRMRPRDTARAHSVLVTFRPKNHGSKSIRKVASYLFGDASSIPPVPLEIQNS